MVFKLAKKKNYSKNSIIILVINSFFQVFNKFIDLNLFQAVYAVPDDH